LFTITDTNIPRLQTGAFVQVSYCSLAVGCRNGVSAVNASTLRQLWSLIENTQTNILLEVNDTELIQQLLKQLENQKLLSSEESKVIRAYISSRLPLIRDLAMLRRSCT
jgi:hypothetical protein